MAQALSLVQLEGMEKRRPSQLSGGQQQGVALARALVLEPAVLLLDEPLGALDAKLRRALQLELKAIQRAVGITFVYVTHDQEEALTMSDRMAVMSEGLVRLGSAELVAGRGDHGSSGDLASDETRLRAEGVEAVYRVGDCVAPPQLIADAIFDGHRLAREIDGPEPAVPLPGGGSGSRSPPEPARREAE